jgi:hypothetical protein
VLSSSSLIIHRIGRGLARENNLIPIIGCGASIKKERKRLNIDPIYLPLYSPNLNPIERLWKVMNEKARNGKCFATTKEFRRRISKFLTITLPEIYDSLDSWINDNFHVLKPALWMVTAIKGASFRFARYLSIFFSDKIVVTKLHENKAIPIIL